MPHASFSRISRFARTRLGTDLESSSSDLAAVLFPDLITGPRPRVMPSMAVGGHRLDIRVVAESFGIKGASAGKNNLSNRESAGRSWTH